MMVGIPFHDTRTGKVDTRPVPDHLPQTFLSRELLEEGLYCPFRQRQIGRGYRGAEVQWRLMTFVRPNTPPQIWYVLHSVDGVTNSGFQCTSHACYQSGQCTCSGSR